MASDNAALGLETRARACRHCGLPLGRAWRSELGAFCCAGCKTVHALIESQGLARYYDLRGGAHAPPPELRANSFAWLDVLLGTEASSSAPSATAPNESRANPAAARISSDGNARLTLDVQGVHCAACVWLLQELWTRLPGAVDLRINPALGRAEFAWRRDELDLREYLRSAERFGYRFGPMRKGDLAASRGLVVRLGICMAAAMNVMIFSLCYYAGLAKSDGALYAVLGRWSAVLATISVAVGGSLFFVAAWRGLRRRIVHLDLPIALGIALAYGGSLWAWLALGPEAAYFDTLTIFVALMVLGRWLQERVLQKNRMSLLSSDGVDDLYTRRRRETVLETIPAAAIEPGDELWILPGDLVPVEGVLLGERASLNLDWITGESRARSFEPGDKVPAGAFQGGDGALRLSAQEGFAASRLHALLGSGRGDESRSETKGRADRWWSRFATIYVVSVLALATLAFGSWWSAGVGRAIQVTLSVLVVTCPCALGLALPLSNELAHAALRRRGIFLRESGLLRRVLRVKHVLFDKTGTLTRGNLKLSAASLRELETLDDESRAVLRNACARSLHPVSRALHAQLSQGGRTELIDALEVRERAGRGLEIRRDGHVWRLGRREFALGEAQPGRSGGATCFSLDGVPLASFEFDEELKHDAADEVRLLQKDGLELHLLSGDRGDRAARVGATLGLPSDHVHGDLAPEDKARRVRELDRRDTWMVGDGINDAPAFDAAFCAATPAIDRPNLPARADLFYLGDGISAVRETLHWARRLARVQRTNLVLAVSYNAIVVTLCLFGAVGPLTAAILMPASSVGFLGLTTLRLTGSRMTERCAPWTS